MRYLLLLFLLCAGTAQAALNIVASTPMVHSLTAQIYGNPSKIKTLSCGNVDCRNKLSAIDNQRLQKAKLIVWMGTEKGVADWLKAHPKANSYAILTQTPDLETLPSQIDTSQPNPYVWTSPEKTSAIINELAKKLSELEPKSEKRHTKNLAQFADRLQFFDGYKLPTLETEYPPLVSLQEGMEYLFDYLGLTNVQTFPVDESNPHYMNALNTLESKVKQANPVCVFVGPNMSKKSIDQLKLPKNIKVVPVNLEGNPKQSGPFLQRIVLRQLFSDVYKCLDMTLPRRER